MKSFCVIGAGPAGLAAVKNCLESGFQVVAFEKGNQVGGTWVYSEDVGEDKYGVEVHSSMYQGLITNLPKEIMEYPDFPYPYDDHSFITSEKMLKYFALYADQFNLRDHIKFEHEVIRVRPVLEGKWEVLVRNLPQNEFKTFTFDFVLVCNGFSVPLIPKIEGQDVLKAKQIHSHDYRKAQDFSGEKVLVIGEFKQGFD
jgi:dimethylaniline monooxygenase (N-oxide forming)